MLVVLVERYAPTYLLRSWVDLDGASHTADRLQHLALPVVVLAFTAASYANGFKGEQTLSDRIASLTGTRALTAAQAILAALHHLRVKKLALGTPYPESISALGTAYWEAAGFEIADRIALYYTDADRLRDIFSAHGDYVREETLAEEISEGRAPDGAYAEEQTVEGEKVTLAVRRVS